MFHRDDPARHPLPSTGAYRVAVIPDSARVAQHTGAAVLFEGVSRTFGAVDALRQASWNAAAASVTCVLGPNGAGKSTAVEIAAGLQRPDAGRVTVLGTAPWGAPAGHRARVGVMLQDGGLPQAARPVALLTHLARFYAAPWPVNQLCQRLDITAFARTPVRRLSGGQRTRLALAAALVGRPHVLFLDEPTSGLDPHARRVAHRIVREVADSGTAVVLSTHTFDEAERLADRVVILADGQVAAHGSLASVRDGASLEQRYFALTERSDA